MKKIYFFLVAVALFVSGATASAQFMNQGASSKASSSADVEDLFSTVEFTYSPVTMNSSIKYDGDSVKSSEDLNAISLNWAKVTSLPVDLPLYLQYGAGVQYAWMTDSESEGDYSSKSTTSFLTAKVPVNVMYYFQIPSMNIALLPYAGLNLQGHILGQQKYTVKYDGESESETISFFSKDDMDDEPYNRFVVGWQIGAKVAFDKYIVGIAYEGPVTNLYKFNEDGVTAKMNSTQINISVGIKF